jgi:putative membrane protein
MYWYGNGMSGWGYVLMGTLMVLFAALLIVGVVVLLRYLHRAGRPVDARSPVSAEQLLAQRYARGELDDEVYQQRLAVLHGQPPVPTS